MTLDIETLYKECRGSVFDKGKSKYYDDAVKSVTTGIEEGKFAVFGVVKGAVDHHCRILFDEMGGLYDYSCDCDGFSMSDGPCKHVVALALSFEERHPQTRFDAPAKRKTDSVALALIADYNKKKQRRSLVDDDIKVELIPYFSYENGVSLRFSLGRRKQYNLKDISDFISALQGCAYRRYGVDLELYHSLPNFTPESVSLIKFLERTYREKTDGGVSALKYKDEIRLLGGDVDDFLALYEGKFLPIDKQNMLYVCKNDENPPIKVKIVRADDGFEVSLSTQDARFLKGKAYDYLLTGARVYRCEKELTEAVKDFFDTAAIAKSIYLAQSDMTLFYNSVLTTLARYLELEAPDVDLSAYEADPLVCKVFVDGEADGVRVRVESSYDEVKFDLFGETFSSDFVREWDSENLIRGIFAKYFPKYPLLQLTQEGEIFEFLSDGIRELAQYAEIFVVDKMKNLKIRPTPRIRVGVRLSENLLSLDVQSDGYTQEELVQIIAAYRERKRYLRIGGGFVDLNDASVSAISEILENATVENDRFTMPSYYAPYVNDELQHGFFGLERDSSFKGMIKSLDGAESDDLKVPAALDGVMRNYQKTGYRWLNTLVRHGFGGILADDMGLGKSLQVIALLCERPCKAIVVCPTTLVLNWQNEIRKFAPHLSVLCVSGGQDARKEMIEKSGAYDVVVTSYDLIRRDVELYGQTFDYAIADEAQFIKNPETRNAIAVKQIKSVHRFALTGTPIENHLGELWSIFDFIMPKYLGSYKQFKEKYEIGIVKGDVAVTEKLKRIVKPFILRRLKSDVLKELPPKMESDLTAPLEGEQRKLYEANLALIRQTMGTSGDYNRVVVLSMLTKLRQICCDPSLVYPDYTGNSAKLDSCLELIASAIDGGHKILLFSQFTSMLDVLRRKLMEMGVSFYVLKGDTPKTERVRLVNRFNVDDTKVFLISLKAGGTGLNLTGADVVIHYDPWWNESVMNQATDRAYRMGQDKKVQVYRLLLEKTLEEKIMELQEKKSALSSLVVGKENGVKEILELLREEE